MRQWYHGRDGKTLGPIDEATLQALFRSGELPDETLVWSEGMPDWASARDLPLFSCAGAGAPSSAAGAADGPLYLHIPVGRLILLGLLSMGLYEAYWIYRNWRYVKERDGLEIRPFWRGIFGIFFVYGILKRIREDAELNRIEPATFSPGGLAAGWIVLVLAGNLLAKSSDLRVNLFGLLVALPSFLLFLPVQEYLQRVNVRRNPQAAHLPWTTGHWVCAVLGLISWMAVLGTLGG